MKISKVNLAYIAGLIDGEGCINVHVDNRSNSLIPRIRVAMCDKEAVMWLQKNIDGSNKIIYKDIRKKYPDHSPVFEWCIQGIKAVSFAKVLTPFLKVKKRQSRLLAKWPIGIPPGQGRKVEPKMLKERIKIHDELRKLKTKSRGSIRNNYFYDKK